MVVLERPDRITKQAVGCIILVDDKILMTHRKKDGKWGSVAETVKKGECSNDAVRRGLMEELYLEAEPSYFATTYHQYDKDVVAYSMYVLALTAHEYSLLKFNPDEILDLRLCSLEEAKKLDLYEDEEYCLDLFSQSS